MFNRRTLKIEESIHVVFDEFSSSVIRSNGEDQQDWITSPSTIPFEEAPKQQGSPPNSDSLPQDTKP